MKAPVLRHGGDSHLRSIVKAVSWRCVGTLDTFLVSFLVLSLSGAADNILFLDDAPHLASPGASWYEASAPDIYDRQHTVYWEIVTEDGRTGIDVIVCPVGPTQGAAA